MSLQHSLSEKLCRMPSQAAKAKPPNQAAKPSRQTSRQTKPPSQAKPKPKPTQVILGPEGGDFADNFGLKPSLCEFHKNFFSKVAVPNIVPVFAIQEHSLTVANPVTQRLPI